MERAVAVGAVTVASGEGLPELLLTAAMWLAVSLLCALLYWAGGLYILRRRGVVADERGRLFGALWLVALAGCALALETHAFTEQIPLFSAPVLLLFLLVFYLRSDSRFASTRVRWLTVLYVLATVGAFGPRDTSSQQQNAQYVAYIPGLLVAALQLVGNTLGVTTIVIGIVPQIYARYRQRFPATSAGAASGWQRWRPWAAALGGGFLLLLVASGLESPPSASPSAAYLVARTGYFLLASLLPAAGAFALALGRPYDRDAFANRALIYVPLSLCLLAIYGVCIVALMLFFPGFGALPTTVYLPFLVVIGLLMFVAYRPLRALIQEHVQRRFFRRRYEAEQVLAAFESTAREDARLDRLGDGLLTALQKAFHPAGVTLWLRAGNGSAQVRRPPSLVAQVSGDVPADVAPPMPSPPVPGELRLQRQATTADEAPPIARPMLAVVPDDPLHSLLLSGSHALVVAGLPDPTASPAAGTLRASGAMVAVPLLAHGALTGVIGSGMPTSGPDYTADERELLGTLAERVAPAFDAARLAHEQEDEQREREQAEQELQTARRIQEALLPKVVPRLAGWQIAALYQPARAVGGDFYDFIELRDGRLALVLGDVTDKGIPAALVMATTRSMLRAVATQHDASPGGVLARVNELLCADLPPSMFVTCFYAILDPASGRLCFANAGQDLPYCRRTHGEVGELRATGMPLGLMPDMHYEERETTLAAGESVLFYSDGLVEAHNPRREMFGFPRLSALLASCDDVPPIVTLLSELAAFTGPDWEQEDDITLVALRRGDGDEASPSSPAKRGTGGEDR
ncbi:MAG TPA: PP2C family protein-serine/threonine phosphatase [Ktedonobacterales bacterium]|nr:PP2C family protein-serine/threonine phosphatase [Ktedonobacterales bacterium]